jgi:hypothetical protein
MEVITSFFKAIVIITMLLMGLMLTSDLIVINHYASESQNAIVNSVTESFSTLSLENLSYRSKSNAEDRNINLTKLTAVESFKRALKINLDLDESLMPRSTSFIVEREAVKIRTINVVNRSMLPLTYNGQVINEESIIVELDLPIKLSFARDKKFMKVSKIVSLETFLTIKEK